MAKAICAKSGIQFDIQYFPYSFLEGELYHPVFDIPYEVLTGSKLLQKWINREFTETDTKLYFLALLNITNLVEFRTYARPTIAICESNIEPLLNILGWMNTIQHPAITMPHMTVSQDTATLDNVRMWISAWNGAKDDFESGYKELTRNQLMLRKEDSLQRLIKDQQKEMNQFAGLLASWASLAAEFPTFAITVNGTALQCDDYWKDILVTCAKSEQHIWRLDIDDMKELLGHMEENLEHGSIYAFNTMKLLRDGIYKHENYLGFNIINSSQDIEQANLRLLSDNAPLVEPKLHEYANKILYLKDKIKWNHAQKNLNKEDGGGTQL
jgi:hypothetical protein